MDTFLVSEHERLGTVYIRLCVQRGCRWKSCRIRLERSLGTLRYSSLSGEPGIFCNRFPREYNEKSKNK